MMLTAITEEYVALKMKDAPTMDPIGFASACQDSKESVMDNVLIQGLAIQTIQCLVMSERDNNAFHTEIFTRVNVEEMKNDTRSLTFAVSNIIAFSFKSHNCFSEKRMSVWGPRL